MPKLLSTGQSTFQDSIMLAELIDTNKVENKRHFFAVISVAKIEDGHQFQNFTINNL